MIGSVPDAWGWAVPVKMLWALWFVVPVVVGVGMVPDVAVLESWSLDCLLPAETGWPGPPELMDWAMAANGSASAIAAATLFRGKSFIRRCFGFPEG
jgi:hypothetical protein